MIPSSPLARASHCASPSEVASVRASSHARFAEAALISRSVYPFWAKHHSRSFGSAFVAGWSSSFWII